MLVRDAQAVLFDFNGTLSDDETLLADIFKDVAADLGVPLTDAEYAEQLLGRSDAEICQALLARAGHAEVEVTAVLAKMTARYNQAVEGAPRITTEAADVIRQLGELSIPIGVVTGARRATVRPALDAAALGQRFGVVITEEDVRAGKPAPDGFLLAAERLSVTDFERVVVFEDSVPGLDAAHAAGMRAVLVGSGSHGRWAQVRRVSTLTPAVLDLDVPSCCAS